jgi:limonene-1,2-epoxide hydrolase
MSKKTVELKSKRKVDLKEMLIDEVDFCNDVAVMKYENGEISHISGLSKTRTAWLRRGISGGDFKSFKTGADGYPVDSVLKELSEEEKNELVQLVQEYQSLGE